ncbi:MAG: hypothetical protein Q4C34_09360 [Bacteroidales bacterium]|nr:hypothetical protein [Bacteroidales bacterium]
MSITSCNNDIFIENTTPSDHEITIAGDGGEATVIFQPKRLQKIDVDTHGHNDGLTYYDRHGDVVASDSPVSDIYRIRYETVYGSSDIIIDGDRMLVKSSELIESAGEKTLSIILDYGFITETIYVTVTPGAPLVMTSFRYDTDNLRVENGVRTERDGSLYSNKTQSDWPVFVMPYANMSSSICLYPFNGMYKDIHADVPCPVSVDGSWVISDHVISLIIGEQYKYTDDGVDRKLKFEYIIPPGKAMNVICDVTYDGVIIPFAATYRYPVSQREIAVDGNCYVSRPASFKISCDEAD